MADPTTPLRAISYGGGVQSTALLVLATQGRLDAVMGGPVNLAIFANVGDDSEHPTSLDYVRDIAAPWAAMHGIEVVEVCRRFADGSPYPTLAETLTDPDRRGVPAPMFVHGERGSGPARRSCTYSWKVDPIMRELRRRGATPDNPALVAIGISVDEIERAGRGSDNAWERRVYPLLDLRLNRADCAQVIKDAGLPVPPKSSCFFCPYHSGQTWAEMRRDEADLFWRAAEIEAAVNARFEADGNSVRYWLTRSLRPLPEAVHEAQDALFSIGADGCDSGFCFT